MGEHLFPNRPVMIPAGADIQPVRNGFGGQKAAHPFILPPADIIFGRSEHDAHLPERGIGGAGDEIDGVVEIDVVIIITVCEGADIKDTAHGKTIADEAGMAEGEIRGVIPAEAATGYGYAAVTRLMDGAWEYFFEDQPVIVGVPPGSFGRGHRFIIPAFRVEAIRAVDLYLAVLEEPAGGPDEALVFILVVGSTGGGEEDDGIATFFEVPADRR